MNTLNRPLKIASLFAVATVGLVGFAAIAQDCAARKAQTSDAAWQYSSSPNGSNNAVRTEMNRDGNLTTSSVQSEAAGKDSKVWKLGAIALLGVGAGSTAFLAYKSWTAKKIAASTPDTQQPELAHPELMLTTVPREALTDVQSEQEAVESPVLLNR